MSVSEANYLSAVRGRQEFRAAFRSMRDENRRLRDALDRIARFEECFAEAGMGKKYTTAPGEALAQALGEYARRTLDRGCR